MIQSFRNPGTEDVYHGRDTRLARRTCPSSLVRVAVRKLDQLEAAEALGDLRIPPGNRLEVLRVGPSDVEIVDYHR